MLNYLNHMSGTEAETEAKAETETVGQAEPQAEKVCVSCRHFRRCRMS